MTTKITITPEKSIIERAKIYAKIKGKTLSELVENYLSMIAEESTKSQLSPELKKIVGVVKLPNNFDENAKLRSAIEKKHL